MEYECRTLRGFTRCASASRVLGGTPASEEAPNQPADSYQTHDDQGPNQRGNAHHRGLVAESPEREMVLEEPRLHQISGAYDDERGHVVHVSHRDAGSHT